MTVAGISIPAPFRLARSTSFCKMELMHMEPPHSGLGMGITIMLAAALIVGMFRVATTRKDKAKLPAWFNKLSSTFILSFACEKGLLFITDRLVGSSSGFPVIYCILLICLLAP